MVNRKAFLTALKALPKLDDMRLYLQIEQGVCKIEANYWTSQVSVNLKGGASFLPRCRPDFAQLLSAVESAPDTLAFSLEDQLVVSSGGMKARVAVSTNNLEHFVFPINENEIRVSSSLYDEIRYANKIKASDKGDRFWLSKINLNFSRLVVEATDGHMGCSIPFVAADLKNEQIQIPGLSSKVLEKLLSTKAFRTLKIYPFEDKVVVHGCVASDPYVSFNLMFDRIPEKFPDLDQFIQVKPNSQWVVDRKALLNAVKSCKEFVTLSFLPDELKVSDLLFESVSDLSFESRVEFSRPNFSEQQDTVEITFDPALLSKALDNKLAKRVNLGFLSDSDPLTLAFTDGTTTVIMPKRR